MQDIGSIDNMEALDRSVDQNQGVVTLTMERVRDAHGDLRLGVHVRQSISDELRGLGIGHQPRPLPVYQEETVRLYRLGGSVAKLIDAVRNRSDENDEVLREAAGGDAADTLNKIRDLVCD